MDWDLASTVDWFECFLLRVKNSHKCGQRLKFAVGFEPSKDKDAITIV